MSDKRLARRSPVLSRFFTEVAFQGGTVKNLDETGGACDQDTSFNRLSEALSVKRFSDWDALLAYVQWLEDVCDIIEKHGASADLSIISQVTGSPRTRGDWWHLFQLISRGLAMGAKRLNHLEYEWLMSGDCTSPFRRTMAASPTPTWGKWAEVTPTTKHSLVLYLETRCRKCDNCRKYRRRHWAARACIETGVSVRTWKCTYTLAPEYRMRVLNQLRDRDADQQLDFDQRPPQEQYRKLHAVFSKEFTRMFKRLRFNTGCPFRYLLVAEAHADGFPHYHALIHESDPHRPLSYRQLKAEWSLGFTNFKLVSDLQEATYLCKYLSKDMLARVRASMSYGVSTVDTLQRIDYDNNRVI